MNISISVEYASYNSPSKNKYESQYHNVTFINNNSIHDRFIILDRVKLYSCGASFKDLGKKCFAINEFSDYEHLSRLLGVINK